MKRSISLFLLLLLCIASKAQNHRGLDPTFGDRGKVLATNGVAMAVLVQPDQKIVVTGTLQGSMTTIRYNVDGTTDNTFGVGGKCISGFPFAPFSIISTPRNTKLQPDGKILISGSVNSGDIFVQRLKANGTIDSVFGHDGAVVLTISTISVVNGATMALQPDGKIVLAGDDNDTAFYVVRLKADGTVDTTFGTNGRFSANVGPFGGNVAAVEVMNDGRIVLDGKIDISSSLVAMRLLPNGVLDTSFAHTGFSNPYSFPGLVYCKDLQLQANGKIILGGYAGGAYLLRVNVDGTLDTSFGGNEGHPGLFKLNTGKPQQFIMLPDGKIAGGGRDDNDENFFMLRTTANGKGLDATFGDNGLVTTHIQDAYGNAMYGIGLQQDGKIVAVGNSVGGTNPNYHDDFTVVRYLQNAPTAVKHIGEPDGLRIYPNPATDWVTILSNANQTIERADIIASDGRLARSVYPVPTTIDIDGIPSGLYYLKVYFTHGQQPAVQKLFIQNSN